MPPEKRGKREQCLFIFSFGTGYIFEYKAFQEREGNERKVLEWVLLQEGRIQCLTFNGMGFESREFKEGKLTWNEKNGLW